MLFVYTMDTKEHSIFNSSFYYIQDGQHLLINFNWPNWGEGKLEYVGAFPLDRP